MQEQEKFVRFKEDITVFRLYFTNSSITLSKRKCGHLIQNIIDKCKRDNKKYRNDFVVHRDFVEVFHYIYRLDSVISIFVDLDDWEKYHMYYFYTTGGYPHITYNGEKYRIHRLFKGLPSSIKEDGRIVDHLNGNNNDNRKNNLKITTHKENSRNLGFFNPKIVSGVRGVTKNNSKLLPWRVRFGNNHKAEKRFNSLSEAVEYRYKKGEELGYYFREGSTTIENYIRYIRECEE